jgi:WD repeat-containing protein 70
LSRPIITPHSLPQFRESHANPQRIKEKLRNDPTMSKKPEQPLQGPFGKGGRISSSGTVSQYVMKSIHKLQSREQDPREALLKFEEEARENPSWVTPAYASKTNIHHNPHIIILL